MNLPPPPETEDITELKKWIDELYRFLQYPVFHSIRLYPRATASKNEKGAMFYDSDDDLFKGYTGSWDEFGDMT